MKQNERQHLAYPGSNHHYSWLFKRRFVRARIRTAAFILAAGAITIFACDKDDDDVNYLSPEDRSFALTASLSNTAEIRAGQLAATKATDAGIRSFGQMMVNDHQTVQAELKSLSADLGVHTPDSLDAEHVALEQQLKNSTGRTFDSIYIHSQVKDHEKAVNLFRTHASQGNHWQLRDYAGSHIHHLEMHLAKADSLANYYK